MSLVRVILCLVLWFLGSGSGFAHGNIDPLPCKFLSSTDETLAAVKAAAGRSVLWVHRQGLDFPPCAKDAKNSAPYWVINQADSQRRFYVYTHDALNGVYSASTRRDKFVTLDELSRGIENLPGAATSNGSKDNLVQFARNVYAAEEYLVIKLVCSGTLAGILLAIGLWKRDRRLGLIAARAAAGCPLALYAGGSPGLIYWMLIIPWILAAFVPVRITLGFTTIIVLLDQLTGLRYGDFSPLQGYFGPGIRFYGVGNELLGIITGTLAVCVPKKIRIQAAIACVLFFGNASLGADFGAVVTFAALAAADILWLIPTIRNVALFQRLIVSVGIGIGTAVFAAWMDMMFSPKMSHAGAAMTAAKSSGIGHLLDIVTRKVIMNIEIAVRPATLIACAAVSLLVWLGRRVFVSRLHWQSGVRYLSFAVALSLIFNDSGVVTALMALLPALAMIPEVYRSNG
ncbi:MAG: hypothetical protein ACOVP2_04570 [Armatimonadaceae bacterium]